MKVLGGIDPLYLSDVQMLDDILPLDAAEVGVDPASTRYLGESDGYDIYLSVGPDSGVYVISVPIEDASAWTAALSSLTARL